MGATGHMWLLSPCDVLHVAKEMNFSFDFILFNINLNSHMWLVFASTGLGRGRQTSQPMKYVLGRK